MKYFKDSSTVKTYVYIIGTGVPGKTKVGITFDVKARLAQLQTGFPEKLLLLFHIKCKDRRTALNNETHIHHYFKVIGKELLGEWVDMDENSFEIAKRFLEDNHGMV